MGSAQYVSHCVSVGRCKFETSHFEQLSIRVAKIDRIHEAAIDGAGVFNPKFLQACGYLGIRGTRHCVSNMMQVANIFRIGRRIINARGSHKERDKPSISRVKIKVHLFWYIQVRLLENEWHSKNPLIEINNCLTVRANEGNMVDTLGLDFGHSFSPQPN